jgi:hypothetical protein
MIFFNEKIGGRFINPYPYLHLATQYPQAAGLRKFAPIGALISQQHAHYQRVSCIAKSVKP